MKVRGQIHKALRRMVRATSMWFVDLPYSTEDPQFLLRQQKRARRRWGKAIARQWLGGKGDVGE